jgi:hypothetical protein
MGDAAVMAIATPVPPPPTRLPPVRELLKATLRADANLLADTARESLAATRTQTPRGSTPRGFGTSMPLRRPAPPKPYKARRPGSKTERGTGKAAGSGARSLREPPLSARGGMTARGTDSRKDSLASSSTQVAISTPRQRRLAGGLSDRQMQQDTGRAPDPWWWAPAAQSSSRSTYVHWLYAQCLGFQGFSVSIGAHGQLSLTVPATVNEADAKMVVARAVEQGAHAELFEQVSSALRDARAVQAEREVADAKAKELEALGALEKKVTELEDISKPSEEQLEEKAGLEAGVAAAAAAREQTLVDAGTSLPDGCASHGPLLDLLPHGCEFQGLAELTFDLSATFGDYYEGNTIVAVLRKPKEGAAWLPLESGESFTLSSAGLATVKLRTFCTIMVVWTKGLEHQSAVVQMLSTGLLASMETNGQVLDASGAANFSLRGVLAVGVSRGVEDEGLEGAEGEGVGKLQILQRSKLTASLTEQVKTCVFEDIFRREKDAEAAAEEKRLKAEALAAVAARKAALPDMLRAAAKAGEASKVQELLEEGAGVNDADANGWTALYTATVYGKEDVVAALLGWSSPAPEVDRANGNGVTALMAAARDGYTAVVMQLLEAGADFKQVDEFGRTADSVADEKGFPETCAAVKEWAAQHA